ncbi:MAG: TonB-dependent receptor [Candidatus Eremiobacteraeota bacterium]|nr:TonB-dependent receptor [Candidatus Eremiobacteraeota bacterium]
MTLRRWFHRVFASLTVAVFALTAAPAAVYAGTTGALRGVVVDQSGAPVAGVQVTASSPSERATSVTDAGGHFAFVSLAPDEYTLGAEKDGYDQTSFAGVAVFADATQVVTLHIQRSLKTIARVTSQSAGSLVRAGTTSDVYSVNAAQQERASVLGGGGNLNSAYSAIASVPGAYVPTNQAGYNQAVHVRGGDASEVGYEFDGIPVNRGFDNYPSGSASSLGQTELQVYTGATPANAEGQGLAGFINQVIKTGTYPGYGSFDGTLGSPMFYHSLNVEAGGSSPDRLFSYYVGVGGFNQDHRYIDQFNGEAYANNFGPPLDQCPAPGTSGYVPPASCFTNGSPNVSARGAPGYILGPMPFGNNPSGIQDRTVVANFHVGIPHKKGGLKDDVQLLFDSDSLQTPLYVSALDEGLSNFQGSTYAPGTTPYYQDSFQYSGSPGTLFTDADTGQITPYFYPSSPTGRAMFANIPLNTRDVQYNNQEIVKLQYQKNFSEDAFLRIYGYTYYSDYVATGAVSSFQPFTGLDSGDYELNSHTRGLSALFTTQLNSQHLLSLGGSYVTATSTRMNNSTMFNGLGFSGDADNFAELVNPNSLTNGTCYSIYQQTNSGPVLLPAGPATATSCGTGHTVAIANPATFASLASSYAGAPTSTEGTTLGTPGDLSQANLSAYTCGGAPCSLYTVENGFSGKYNTVKPNFIGASLQDEWRPNDKFLINLGLRWDQYQYQGSDTTGTAARAFWFNAFNQDTCFNTVTLQLVDKSNLEPGGFDSSASCATLGSNLANLGSSSAAPLLLNVPSQVFTYNVVQPRVGATYTINPDTVVRASYGKYIEQPSAAYEQYNALQQNLPDQLAQFYPLGFNTPGHAVRPPVSYNLDFSYERHFKGTDMSIKVTPFLRQTHDQIENFYLNIQQAFISGLNAGNQTSTGFELAFTKGDFNRDGFAAQFGFAYTYAYLTFSQLPNGTTILSPINAGISTYNAFTSACGQGGALVGKSQYGQPLCGQTPTGVVASPCYAGGVADTTCTDANTVANPYWNAPAQPFLDPNGKYLPYSTIPGGIGTGVNAYTYPYVASLILQYRHRKLAVTPSLQWVAGNRYGAPETTPGVDPSACTALTTGTAGDPRYPYGAAGGSPYDATSCGAAIVIPDSYTGQFDGLGVFREPTQLLGHLRISYDFSPRITGTVTLANLLSTCYGGQQTAFTYYWNRNVCSYGAVDGGLVNPVGNDYNPGDNVQTNLKYPYQPIFATYNDQTTSTLNPFQIYFELKVKV